MLVNRSREQIITAADIISWLSESALVDELHREEVQKAIDAEITGAAVDDDEIEVDNCYGAELQELVYVMGRMSLEGISEAVPNLTWSELFAVLALGIIDDAVEWERNHRWQVQQDNAAYHRWHGRYAAEAMEAVCMAEQLTRVREETRKAISSSAQRAVLKRHQAVNNLKREFFRYYHSGSFPSYAEAARRFYQGLEQHRKKLLKPTNAVRTLADALAANLKQK